VSVRKSPKAPQYTRQSALRFQGLPPIVRANIGVWPRFVVGHSLQVIGLAQEGREGFIDARLAFRQPVKLALYALMGFGNLAGLLEDEGLRGMEHR